jgi:hypothetical protein
MAADSPTPTKLGFIGAGIMGASRIRPKPETLRFFFFSALESLRRGAGARNVSASSSSAASSLTASSDAVPNESTPPYLRSEKTNERRRRSHGLEPDEGWP